MTLNCLTQHLVVRGQVGWWTRSIQTTDRFATASIAADGGGLLTMDVVVEQDIDVVDIEFDAEGATLRGWLFCPRSVELPMPVVVMAHGYNCLKEFYLDTPAATDGGRQYLQSRPHEFVAFDERGRSHRSPSGRG